MYQLGYDVEGRTIVIDEYDRYVTHIPCNLSAKEVLDRLNKGISVSFDGMNQGMQNCPEVQYDYSDADIVAPREQWPLFRAWEIHGTEDVFFEDMRTFEEYREEFYQSGLTPEEEMQIINAWLSIKRTKGEKIRNVLNYDNFRQICIGNINNKSYGR